MKPLKTLPLLLVLVAALAAQGKTKKPYKLPAVFNQARYVYVEAVDGQQFNPRLLPEDRQAIADVQNALQDWSRYILTVRRDEAELIFVVRKGRLADAEVGVRAGTGSDVNIHGGIGSQSGPRSGPQSGPQSGSQAQGAPGQTGGAAGPGIVGAGVGGEVGPPDDLLEGYVRNPEGSPAELLWMHTKAGGLDSPKLALFQQFKDAVERTYPQQTASQPKKP